MKMEMQESGMLVLGLPSRKSVKPFLSRSSLAVPDCLVAWE